MTKSPMMIRLKRAYVPPDPEDGLRILVQRLWPRGLTKQNAAIDVWPKEISPSPTLRQWYAHDLSEWDEFRERYRAELHPHAELIKELRRKAQSGQVTFVYAAKDEVHNSAVLLKEYLER
jgi:uncharacterized protein YeaO (DUF488 family)